MKVLTWTDTEAALTKLANIISKAHTFDCVCALARGGFIPAYYLSRLLSIRLLCAIGITYSDENRSELCFYHQPLLNPQIGHILLVEDQVETGRSLIIAQEYFQKMGLETSTCALFVWEKASQIPSFFLEMTKSKGGVVFPWESTLHYTRKST